jgi:copper(I)-binding protein
MQTIALNMLLAVLTVAVTMPAIATVLVSGAWVGATVEGQTSTGAYMVINSDHDVALIGAEAQIAGHAAIHEMRMHGNMMMMMPVERLAVPAGHAVDLDEHNYHVMLDDLKHQVKPGEMVTIRLKFIDAKGGHEDVLVSAVVRELTAHEGHDEQMGHMHDGMGNE